MSQEKKEPGKELAQIPVEDKYRNALQDIGILRAGYQECIKDLEASNKQLVQYLGMDPVELTGEVMGHQAVLNEVSARQSGEC